ncbi:HAMP domain-containing sensor histidine kinase [Epilithonimonas sp.]|uniref:sensor histidine kinase n=1 Tax=Epilithonimonas sp. TaxID=2894511 RepID=UPI002897A2D8|nr:HAMP domain-containing sensor histidine kinase [Epilithonimonas sp.]
MKGLNFLKRINSWVVYFIMTAIVFGISVSSFLMIDQLRKQEIQKINLIATALKAYTDDEISADPKIQELYLAVMQDNTNLPIVVTDKKKNPIFQANIPPNIEQDSIKLKNLIRKMENSYEPFVVELPSGENQYIYYDNSDLLNYFRYYPYILALFIGAYLVFSFWFLRTLKKTDEGFVWAGLAKETAHQIGTPLSSMIGWVEIMKLEDENGLGVKELEMDVNRLKTISERFSKIGSIPELTDLDINETIQQNFDYLKKRISTKVNFTLRKTYEPVLVPHSRILMSWVIENLVKNAVDAMKGEGKLELSLYKKNKNIYIDVTDTGSGMTKQQIRNAFKPGFSTKKRGWGLGLSLTKRVVSEYHRGDVRIAQSEVGKGTTFRIVLREEQKS